jgi:hypothetical protein
VSADFESPFLDRDTPVWPNDEERETPSRDLESPFDKFFAEAESPFLSGEAATDEESPFLRGEFSEAESPFLTGEWTDTESETEGPDPSLFDPAELESSSELSWESGADDESESPTPFGDENEYGSNGASESEFVLMNERDDEASEGEGEFVLLNESENVAEESQLSGDEFPVLTRILWPALGFPAVITPSANPKKDATLDVDSTRCLTLLVLTNTSKFPANEVAKRLRVVPWSARTRRHIAEKEAGSFSAEDIVVRADQPGNKLTLPQPRDATEQLIGFGEGAGPINRTIVNLSTTVRKIYKGWGMEFLYEIRLSEAATARLGQGQFHVFFNNLKTTKNDPSDEMTLLIRLGAQRRAEDTRPLMPKSILDPREEYQYEYGTVHKPQSAKRTTKHRAEVLHPVFIRKTASPKLRIGHVTDLHVDVRHDVYEFNLARAKAEGKVGPHSFNNWNTSVSQIYAKAKEGSDALMLTGDLIDYGRAHAGIDFYGRLGENDFYQRDRNWLLLYDVLAGAERYTVPVYTSLGNHDWRINPYPPFVPGAPGPRLFINDYDCFNDEKLKAIITHAHRDGADQKYSYDPRWKSLDLVDYVKMLAHGFQQQVKLEKKGLPTETNVDSVLWYLLTINPFFDYAWALPSKHRLLMLDWAEDEGILFKRIENGVVKDYKVTPSGMENATRAGPKAVRCLSSTQKLMVEQFVKIKNPAKVIGIHAPAIGPWSDWGEDDLRNGFKQYHKSPTRGPHNYAQKKNGKTIALNGHPIFAVPPKKGPKGHLAGMDPDEGTFMQHREWFVRTLAAPDAGVRLVLSGHIHRNGRFGVRIGTKADGDIVAGELLLTSLEHKEVQGAAMPAISTNSKDILAPLYVNTTSAGPRGNNHPTEGQHLNVDPGFARIELMADGVITLVSFQRPVDAPKPSCDVGKAREAKKLPAFAF